MALCNDVMLHYDIITLHNDVILLWCHYAIILGHNYVAFRCHNIMTLLPYFMTSLHYNAITLHYDIIILWYIYLAF